MIERSKMEAEGKRGQPLGEAPTVQKSFRTISTHS